MDLQCSIELGLLFAKVFCFFGCLSNGAEFQWWFDSELLLEFEVVFCFDSKFVC